MRSALHCAELTYLASTNWCISGANSLASIYRFQLWYCAWNWLWELRVHYSCGNRTKQNEEIFHRILVLINLRNLQYIKQTFLLPLRIISDLVICDTSILLYPILVNTCCTSSSSSILSSIFSISVICSSVNSTGLVGIRCRFAFISSIFLASRAVFIVPKSV